MTRILIFIVSITFLFTSCKAKKGITDMGNTKKMSIAKIIKKNNLQKSNFTTLRANLKVNHTTTTKSQSFSISLRMLKDQKIWMSFKKAGISGGKALITPQKVQFYNKLENTYFDGDFKIISKLLGTTLSFQQLQNILLGEAAFTLEPAQYDVEILKNGYLLYPEEQVALFEYFTTINPSNFKIKSQEINQPQRSRILNIDYKSYQEFETQLLPLFVHIVTVAKTNESQIDITYKNILLNSEMRFPFNIPSGYKAINIE